MAENISPKQQAAVRVGQRLVSLSKGFMNGVKSGVSFGAATFKATGEKIKVAQKRIALENKKQARFDREYQEFRRRKAAALGIELTQLGKPVVSTFRSLAQKPFEALAKLIMGWAIYNLPRLLKSIENFKKRIEILKAAIVGVINRAMDLATSVGKIVNAYIKNLLEFDFADKSGRVKKATDDLNSNIEAIGTNLSEFTNVWTREEDELDAILASINSGARADEAITSIGKNVPAIEAQTPIVGGDAGGGGGTGGGTGGGWKGILDLIGKAESDSLGGYNAVNRGSNHGYVGGPSMSFSDIKKPLVKMTIGEVLSRQKKGEFYAAGRYQFIPTTLEATLARAGLTTKDLYNEANQDKLAIALAKSVGVTEEVIRKDPTRAGNILGGQWAGLPSLTNRRGAYRNISRGQSYYAGDRVNKATITPAQLESALKNFDSRQAATPAPAAAPVKGSVVDTTNVSANKHPTVGLTTRFRDPSRPGHMGIDIGTSRQKGWLVSFMGSGKVTVVSNDAGGWGKYVVIYISSLNMSFLFGHLEKVFVKQGEPYNQQAIGEIGNTGRSFGEHLHFEASRGQAWGRGTQIDPAPYLKYLAIGKQTRTSSASPAQVSSNTSQRSQQIAAISSTQTARATQRDIVFVKETTIANNTIVTPGKTQTRTIPIPLNNNWEESLSNSMMA